MKDLINEEIIKALKILGVQGEITLHAPIDPLRIVVTVNGEYFGIWDVLRKTFVD
jgi:hypothetical protein